MDRTHYIFIDHENVGNADLSRFEGKQVKIFLILGAGQSKLPTSLLLFSQNNPDRLRVIQTPVKGHNALDLVLALELGRQFKADPEADFHIVSKDTDFNSVISHLKNETTRIARHVSLAEIPLLRTPEERFARFKAELKDPTKPRPATREKLENRVRSYFGNQAEPEFIEKTITTFVQAGILGFTETGRILYAAA